MDPNSDGVGDFGGLADRLDHIEALGAACIWLLPFYPTPNRDNGYNVTDFYASVLASRYDWRGRAILILHNLGNQTVDVKVPLEGIGRLRPLFCDQDDRAMRNASDPISLNPYGYRWLRAQGERR